MITNVLQYLEASSQTYPKKPAIRDVDTEFSYEETLVLAKAIGSRLLSLGQVRRPIVVLIDRDALSVLTFFGIVYSGNFYVPVDKKLPVQRIKTILNTIEPLCVMGKEEDLAAFSPVLDGIQWVSIQESMKSPVNEEGLSVLREGHLDTDPLYAIFTSGSTGVPKGVLVSHRSVVDLVEQFRSTFHFTENEVFGNQAPFDFDVSVKDLYNAICNGATVEILPQSMFVMPKRLIAHLKERKVTTLIWAVSALSILCTLKALDKGCPDTLQKIMFSGEVMPVKVLNYWKSHLPNAMFVNLYGPTEITCNCTYYMVDREFTERESLPIGRPFPNTEILLLDEHLKPVPPGGTGEICVRGTCLALGYYNNPETTAKAFCQNPLNSAYPERIYRTGDMGRYNERGELCFASRRDAQIKHMGHRIELGEIETALQSLSYIENGCCLYDAVQGKIVLFYQARQACDGQLLNDLQNYLPKYMCPNRLLWFEQIPMSKHGKVDRALLKKTYIEKGGSL